MKLKKLGALVIATLLGAALLTACSGDSTDSTATTEAKSMDEIFATISEANPISNPRDLDDMTIELDFMLSLDDIVAYQGIASNDGGDAGMIVVIEATDESADAVFAALETYADNQVVFWSNYEEFADAKAAAEDSRIKRVDNYIVLVIASNEADYADIETALTEALG